MNKREQITVLQRQCRAQLAIAHRAGDEKLMRELSQLREKLKKMASKYCSCGQRKQGKVHCQLCCRRLGTPHANRHDRKARRLKSAL